MKNSSSNLLYLVLLLTTISCSNTNTKLKSLTKEISLTNYEIITYSAEGPCDTTNCSSQYGECVTSSKCECNYGFANLKRLETDPSCTYELKSQKTAFLLELFLWFGAGHFYCNRLMYGLIKFASMFFVIILDFIIKNLTYTTNKARNGMNIFIYCLYFALIVWQLFDIAMFGMNKFSDGNGMPLQL
jgi:hypothetical protein